MKNIIALFIFSVILLLAACQQSSNANKETTAQETTEEEYLKKGKNIAAATFAALSGSLQNAMQEGGIQEAIRYCNLAALPLVDSLSKVHQADIRRTSFKIRNPKDKATPRELKQLEAYQAQIKLGEKLKPVIQEIDAQQVAFYAPIHIMPLCEKCHGKLGTTLQAKDYELLQQLYPADQAINYTAGDWRGMWSISFEK